MRANTAAKLSPDWFPKLDDEQLIELSELLRLLGEPTRLRVLLACLAASGSVGELAARTSIPRSLVSHHLRMLRGKPASPLHPQRQTNHILTRR